MLETVVLVHIYPGTYRQPCRIENKTAFHHVFLVFKSNLIIFAEDKPHSGFAARAGCCLVYFIYAQILIWSLLQADNRRHERKD